MCILNISKQWLFISLFERIFRVICSWSRHSNVSSVSISRVARLSETITDSLKYLSSSDFTFSWNDKSERTDIWPGEDGVVGAQSHQEEDEGEGDDHASPVRVAHKPHPGVTGVEEHGDGRDVEDREHHGGDLHTEEGRGDHQLRSARHEPDGQQLEWSTGGDHCKYVNLGL